MSKLLNQTVATMKADNLIYDGTHPIDGTAVRIVLSGDAAGELKRGQILDYDNGDFKVHASNGTVSAILAEDVAYAAGETEVDASAYLSGTYRQAACVSDVELTADDLEEFRSKGIYLK